MEFPPKSLARLIRNEKTIALAVFTLVSLTHYYPLIENLQNWGANIPGAELSDSDQTMLWYAVSRESVLKFHQFPLWNRYSCGGYPDFALPLTSTLSPYFLAILVFDAVIGNKVIIIASTIFGMYGMFLLSRHLRFGQVSSYLPAFIFFLNSRYVMWMIYMGHHQDAASLSFYPWVFMYYLKGRHSHKSLLVGGVFLALLAFTCSSNYLLFLILFLSVYSLLESIRDNSLKPILCLLVVLSTAVGIAAVKLLPSYEFLNYRPRAIFPAEPGYTEIELMTMLTMKLGTVWRAAYVGWLPIVLAALGFIMNIRKNWVLFLSTLFTLVYSLAGEGYLGIFVFVHSLPFYQSLHDPATYLITFYLPFSLLAADFTSRIEGSGRVIRRLVVMAVILFVIYDLTLAARPILAKSFIIPPPTKEELNRYYDPEFYPEHDPFWVPGTTSYSKYTSDYYPFLLNRGKVNCYLPLPTPTSAIGKYNFGSYNNGYRGEAFLINGNGKASIKKLTPHVVEVELYMIGPDVLSLNQNYYPGWHTESVFDDTTFPLDYRVSTNVSSATKSVRFYYMPLTFVVGGLISVAALMFLLILYRYPVDIVWEGLALRARPYKSRIYLAAAVAVLIIPPVCMTLMNTVQVEPYGSVQILDKFDVGEPTEEKSRGYVVTKNVVDTLPVAMLDYGDGKIVSDRGRLIAGSESFSTPAVSGEDLILRHRVVPYPNQVVDVYVDGERVGRWYETGGHVGSYRGFIDAAFVIPGKKINSDNVRLELRYVDGNVDGRTAVSSFYFWTLAKKGIAGYFMSALYWPLLVLTTVILIRSAHVLYHALRRRVHPAASHNETK